MKTIPFILLLSSLMKLMNWDWLRILEGEGLEGRVDVRRIESNICASLNCPSSNTIPPSYLLEIKGNCAFKSILPIK